MENFPYQHVLMRKIFLNYIYYFKTEQDTIYHYLPYLHSIFMSFSMTLMLPLPSIHLVIFNGSELSKLLLLNDNAIQELSTKYILLPIQICITTQTCVNSIAVCEMDMQDHCSHGSKPVAKACTLVVSSAMPNVTNNWSNLIQMRSYTQNQAYYLLVKWLHCMYFTWTESECWSNIS